MALSERDVCTRYITPALVKAGWDIHTQIREEVTYTQGRIRVRGNMAARGKRKRVDYLLYAHRNIPIAVIEAKSPEHTIGAGLQQAIDYANDLDVPFVYSSNGSGFMEFNRLNNSYPREKELTLDQFPSPDELWQRYVQSKKIDGPSQKIVTQDYYYDINGREPRYYQRVAINRTIEAVAHGQNRILLVMATGTGKTYTAFQIIWRLWKSGMKKRVLFLADRNILVDQTMTNDFKHFGDKMKKITKRQVNKSYEVYLALYQAITGEEESKKIFKKFSRNFFDLIVVDECHRGSAAEDSQWREILEYFDGATQIGLTATPKETKYVSNIHYFGEPVYTYSLKQGIDDGFLAPYKVVRIYLDKDLSGWRPPVGKIDRYGHEVEQRIYNLKDYDRSLVLDDRTKLVAAKVSEFLRRTNRFAKTIVFCEDIEHAERMRHALINENADLVAENDKYVLKITGDDQIGKQELDNFIHPEEKYPVIATTSKLMTTGVDAQTCQLIVLDKSINSMTEFKQIIGRGTRVREDHGKMFFTIMDFRNATRLFYDPAYDGDPVQIYEPGPDDPPVPPEGGDGIDGGDDGDVESFPGPDGGEEGGTVIVGPPGDGTDDGPRKYYVDNVPFEVVAERVQYYDSEKGLVSESLTDFSKRSLLKMYPTLDAFLNEWDHAERKQVIVEELVDKGVFLHELAKKVGKEMDPFDLICHIAFERPPLTRRERANQVKKRDVYTQYGDTARQVLDALLDKYADAGIDAMEQAFDHRQIIDFLKIQPFSQIGTPIEIINAFGDKDKYMQAVRDLETQLYQAA